MLLKNYYYYFKKAFNKKFCEDVINLGLSSKNDLGVIGSVDSVDPIRYPLDNSDLKKLKKTRNSNIAWLSQDWIYRTVHPYIQAANEKAGWNFQWDKSETCQFTKYTKGQFYDWHADSEVEPYKTNDNSNGKIRKLSVTISLNDAKEYKGGRLEFATRNKSPAKKEKFFICKEILEQGSIVIFPSFVWHRVTPVTKGTRYSLVIWNIGYPYK